MTERADTQTGFDADGPLRPAVWPAWLIPSELSVHLVKNTTGFESPFTRFQQSSELLGHQFVVSAVFNGLDAEELRTWRVFMTALRGSANRFYFPLIATDQPVQPQPPFTTTPGPDIVGTGPRIVALAEGVNGLQCAGFDVLEGSLLLVAGDFISFDDENGWRQPFVVTQDCYADSGGRAELVVEPQLPSTVPAGARLHLDAPSAIFCLDTDTEGLIEENPDGHSTVSFNAGQSHRADFFSVEMAP